MVAKRFVGSITRRLRPTVALAMVPLATLNMAPVSAGCLCYGHYEPACKVSLCRSGTAACGCPCCPAGAHDTSNCCAAESRCSHHRLETSTGDSGRATRAADNHGCMPVVHEPVPTTLTAPLTVDVDQTPVLMSMAVVAPPCVTAHVRHRVELETGPPPRDLVVALQRLVI